MQKIWSKTGGKKLLLRYRTPLPWNMILGSLKFEILENEVAKIKTINNMVQN
jgi:hypothetical protein